jgi:hypothetical protein
VGSTASIDSFISGYRPEGGPAGIRCRPKPRPAKRDFHNAATKLLRDLLKKKSEHRKGIKAGLERARAAGKRLGRARIAPEIEEAIRRSLREGGKGLQKIARQHGVGTSAVQRVKAELAQD